MKLLSAEFVTGLPATADMPQDGIPQIAFVGRSNVGKSSLLNALCRTAIARISAAPGKTRLANLYRIAVEGGPGGPGRWSLYFVDLPGYGYARGAADAAAELAGVAEAYFAAARGSRLVPRQARGTLSTSKGGGRDFESRPLDNAQGRPEALEGRHVLLLIDSRHPGLESDAQAGRWLTGIGQTPQIVATKIDKLSRAERARNLKALEDTFGTAALPVSASSGEGLDDLWKLIAKIARKK